MTAHTRIDSGIATDYRIPLDEDFHALPSAVVGRILDAADACGYRRPKNANGSRARYFHAALQRAKRRGD